MKRHCPYCGPRELPYMYYGNVTKTGEPICPLCYMTPGEHAYRARILADSAAVYTEELRAFKAKRAAGLIAKAY